jgi:hypothetical protein
MQNEPNFRRRRKKSGGDAQPTKSRIVRNEPNLTRPGGGDGGNCAKRSQTWADWGIWAMVLAWAVARPGSETCKTNPILRLRISDCGFGDACRLRTDADRLCKTNQIPPRRGRVPEEIVQNEAKLGLTGVYGQWFSRGPRLGQGVKRAKRTQFAACGYSSIPFFHCLPVQCHTSPKGYGGGELCKTNQIWPGRRRVTEETVQNEAKLGGTGVCRQRRLSCGRGPAGE